MIRVNHYNVLTVKDKALHKFNFCQFCALCDSCELITTYIVDHYKNKSFPRYMKPAIWENGYCLIQQFIKVKCGDEYVADGISGHFKIDLKYDRKNDRFRICSSSSKKKRFTKKWEPCQSVFISAQTGGGKNHFIENKLLPYVRKLNHKHKTTHRVLILSNRLALQAQIKDRLETGTAENDSIYYNYGDYVDVMSYQSLLNNVDFLKRIQNQKKSNYLFVICDEAHFFTSDATFNPNTDQILTAITNIFTDAIRIYMTATPYDCLPYIQYHESQIENSIPGVFYHFKRDYSYLNIKYFSDEQTELREIITSSVVNNNEKWLIFIDNKQQGIAFKNLLENNNGEATALKGKVLTVSTESKSTDVKYQKMILAERFDKDTNVVIATSVIDNGVNFRDIENIVITDTERIKCLQMVGRVRIDKNSKTKVNLYMKRHNEKSISSKLKAVLAQQNAYYYYDMARQTKYYKRKFLDKYYDNQENRGNTNNLFYRSKLNPNRLYPNLIARSLIDMQARMYESILNEMEKTDKEKKVTGQKYLEYQLSWFGKKYNKKNDITLNGCKPDSHLAFEKWIKDEWLDKEITKEKLKDFGKFFYNKYHPIFGYCTIKKGFSSDDNRTKNGPKYAGYGIPRIREIFQLRKIPFEIIEDNGNHTIKLK